MNYARIDKGTVVEVATFAENPVMHPTLTWVADPAGTARPGWTYAAGVFAAPVPTLAQAKTDASIAVDGVYAARLAAGLTWNGTIFQIDEQSQANITSMGALAAAALPAGSTVAWPAGFVWIAADNATVPMTAAQMLAFAAAAAGYVSALILRRRALKSAIAAAADSAAVGAIDINSGWPAAVATG